MTDDHSTTNGMMIPEGKNRQLSLPSEMANRGLEIASRIELQSSLQKYQKPIRYFSGLHVNSRIDFSDDGEFALIAASGVGNPDMVIWEVANGISSTLSSKEKGLSNLGYMGNGNLWSMAISSHGDLVVAGYDTYDIVCWDVNNNLIISRHIVGWNTEPVEYLKFLPNEERCIVGYDTGALLINARSGERIKSVCSLNSPGLIELLKGGTKLRVEDNGHMKIKDLQSENDQKIFKDAVNIIAASTFPDSEKIVSLNSGGLITVWNSITGEIISQWLHTNLPLHSPGKALQKHNEYSKVDPQRMMSGRETSIDVSPDGTKILSGGNDNCMRLWTQTGGEICKYPHSTSVIKVAFLPDGLFVLSGCLDGSVYLWEMPG